MTDFTKRYSGYRLVSIQRGDTLQRIAAREMGNATAWTQLAWLNDLVPPFITDDEALAGERVLLSGGLIRIPALAGESAQTAATEAQTLLVDCALVHGQIAIDEATGDLRLVSGRDNLKQAIDLRLRTDMGELIFHPEYGCKLPRRRGRKNNAPTLMLARKDAQEALLNENRLRRLDRITASSAGDALGVQVDVTPISGDPVTVSVSV